MAPKPRGLKASKKAAPFDPSSASASSNAAPAASTERTMPLDQDHLSISDLFELRISAVALLETGDAEKQDEARNLLRGILHGAENLLALLPEDHHERDLSKELDEQDKKLKALGLLSGPYDRSAETYLRYLQGFALHELAKILPPAELLAPAALTAASGSKKRKIDLAEPTDPAVWLDEAIEKYKLALEGVTEEDPPSLLAILMAGGRVRATYERGALAVKRGDREAAQACLSEGLEFYAELTTWEALGEEDRDEFVEEYGDPVSTFNAGTAALIGFIESAEMLDAEKRQGILHSLNASLENQTESLELVYDPDAAQQDQEDKLARKWIFEMSVVVADALLATFVMQEDAVEAKYRPEPEEEEEENEDDEEAEVTPLPTDAEEVQKARTAGEAGGSRCDFAHNISN